MVFDCRTQSNSIVRLSSIEFDETFGLVRLVSSGIKRNQKTWRNIQVENIKKWAKRFVTIRQMLVRTR